MPEPEAELQATANLSPVSPSPVHSAAPLVVPALQDTVDTIDAMVAASAAAAAANGAVDNIQDLDPISGTGDNEDIVDDDSFNDAYAEEVSEHITQPAQQEQPDDSDENDDYAKMFDSPIGPEEGEGEGFQPEDVSSLLRESNDVLISSDHLTSRPSEVSRVVDQSPSAAQHQGVAATSTVSVPETTSGSAAPSQPPVNPDQGASQPVPPPSTASVDPNHQSNSKPPADIQRLVADLTAQSAEPTSSNTDSSSTTSPVKAEPPAGTSTLPTAIPPASLPPRPPLPHSAPQSYASQHHPTGSNSSIPASAIAPPTPGQPSTYVAAGAPGIPADALSNLPPPPATGLNAPIALTSMNAPPYPSHPPPAYVTDRAHDAEYQRQWDQFLADERQYMSEAKWDRFPEGSRIFIGNLSSDKVSKRDVFDLFHRFGRLAQISLKSAYGFVQYHTIEEGRRAMENLQGIEIKGRRIHLEVSRAQDKAKKDGRARSPDRGRGRDSGRRNDRYSHQGRDDYRPARNPSPRRNDYGRDDGYGRDRGSWDGGRGRARSRSPGYGRSDKDSYRRRSPSPFGRSRRDGGSFDLPRRYGADVPDVQIILLPDVSRDFANWVEGAFKAKGLKSEIMFLHPRFPKDDVIRQQAAEGVHAVVDLDLRAQNTGRVPVQAFDRSGGMSNIRFDQYVDLDPNTAAEVILRAKASGAAHYNQPYGGASGYANPYGGPAQQQQQQPPPPPHAPPYPNVQTGQYPPRNAHANPVDIGSLVGQVDNATLQQLLTTIQTTTPNGLAGAIGALPGLNATSAAAPQVDIHAILGSLGGNAAAQQAPPAQGAYGAPYNAQPAPSGGVAPGGANGDATAQVQNIMAQLARYRQ